MNSSKPYLIRALYEWIVDNDTTPYLLVDAEQDDVMVPQDYVQEGKIILNISPGSIRELNLGNDAISFNARFSGKAMDLYIPVNAVLAIYAKENGQGMMFEADDHEPPPSSPSPEGEDSSKSDRPHLKIVK
jgi:stringent starvation protein B